MIPGTQIQHKYEKDPPILIVLQMIDHGFWQCQDKATGKTRSLHSELIRDDYKVVLDAKQEELF
jgi:hypothetical protein